MSQMLQQRCSHVEVITFHIPENIHRATILLIKLLRF